MIIIVCNHFRLIRLDLIA